MIYIYEDEGTSNLYPLVDLRPVFDLRCGRFTLREKLTRLCAGRELNVWVRETHAALTAELHPTLTVNAPFKPPALFLSARAIFETIPPITGPDALLVAGTRTVGFRLNASRTWTPGCLGRLQLDLPEEPVSAYVINSPWELVEQNLTELAKETSIITNENRSEPGSGHGKKKTTPKRRAGSGPPRRKPLPPGVSLVGPRDRLHVAATARIWPGAVISTETGPVWIDETAQVRPGSFIEGPCYVGSGTLIDSARVRPGCTFGPQCRIGGEVEASIFQGFANKHHDGFIGHSYVGEWVNLGAMTTNSDLRNDYATVKIMRGQTNIDTGLLKVGCFIGDHVKTAIGTLLNTGAIVGTFANWFEPGLSPKEIRPFSRGADARQSMEDILYTCRQVMSRRGRTPGPAYITLITRLFENTAG